MKAKLIIEGKEIEVEISEEEYKKLQPSEEKKTGYERVPKAEKIKKHPKLWQWFFMVA